jgi:hypothetical protein
MSKYTLKERSRYFFDSTLSSGPLGLLVWLGLFSITVIILVASFVWIIGASPKESILEQACFYTLTSLGAFWNAEGGTWLFRLIITSCCFYSNICHWHFDQYSNISL